MRGAHFCGHDWSGDVGADANGAPTRDFLLIFNYGRLAAGIYKLSFKGRASVGAPGVAKTGSGSGSGAGAFIQNQQYDPATNTTTADVVLPFNVKDNSWLAFSDTRRSAAFTTTISATLPEGLSVVRIRPLSNWVWVKDLVVQ